MKAKFSTRVNATRNKLSDVLPLQVPFSMFIDVSNACNFKCKFCALHFSDKEMDFKKMCMDYEAFKKIIDDMKGFSHPLKMLKLQGFGEPLLNKNLAKMIQYAKDAQISDWIETVTNASLLTPALNRDLITAGLNRICISIEAMDEEGYAWMSGAKLNWKKFVDNIRDFYENRKQCEVYIKIVDAAVEKKEQKEKFFSVFGDISDQIFIEHINPVWPEFDEINENFELNQQEGVYGNKIEDVDICPFPFYSCVVNSDGEVTVCCVDWERKISMGNASTENICDIWHGDKYNQFLIKMLEKGRKRNKLAICAKCNYPCYNHMDSLDDDRNAVLERMKKGLL